MRGASRFCLLVTIAVCGAAFAVVAHSEEPTDWVEGTQDLDDGATRDYYNRAARLSWDNYLGDWRDTADSPQGSSSYAHVDMVDDDTWEYIEWDVTDLVQEWVDGIYPNQGFFVRLVSGCQHLLLSQPRAPGGPGAPGAGGHHGRGHLDLRTRGRHLLGRIHLSRQG